MKLKKCIKLCLKLSIITYFDVYFVYFVHISSSKHYRRTQMLTKGYQPAAWSQGIKLLF